VGCPRGGSRVNPHRRAWHSAEPVTARNLRVVVPARGMAGGVRRLRTQGVGLARGLLRGASRVIPHRRATCAARPLFKCAVPLRQIYAPHTAAGAGDSASLLVGRCALLCFSACASPDFALVGVV